jgi:hypothetical protein
MSKGNENLCLHDTEGRIDKLDSFGDVDVVNSGLLEMELFGILSTHTINILDKHLFLTNMTGV